MRLIEEFDTPSLDTVLLAWQAHEAGDEVDLPVATVLDAIREVYALLGEAINEAGGVYMMLGKLIQLVEQPDEAESELILPPGVGE